MNIELFMIPEDKNNDAAKAELEKLDATIRATVCAPEVRKVYLMPSIRVEHGLQAFGIENIRNFVSSELAARASTG